MKSILVGTRVYTIFLLLHYLLFENVYREYYISPSITILIRLSSVIDFLNFSKISITPIHLFLDFPWFSHLWFPFYCWFFYYYAMFWNLVISGQGQGTWQKKNVLWLKQTSKLFLRLVQAVLSVLEWRICLYVLGIGGECNLKNV